MSKDSSDSHWPHPLSAVLLTILLFICGQVIALVLIGGLREATGATTAADGRPELFGSAIVMQFAFALAAYGSMLAGVFILISGRISRHDLGLQRPRLSALGYAALAFVAYMASYVVLISVISPLVPGLDTSQRQDTGFGGAAGVWPLLLTFLALVVVAPVAEEVVMRGYLFGSLRRRLPFWLATAITSIIFGAMHLGGGEQGTGLIWIAAIDTLILSFVLCYLREKTGSLWASIALHVLKNGIAFTMLFIFVD